MGGNKVCSASLFPQYEKNESRTVALHSIPFISTESGRNSIWDITKRMQYCCCLVEFALYNQQTSIIGLSSCRKAILWENAVYTVLLNVLQFLRSFYLPFLNNRVIFHFFPFWQISSFCNLLQMNTNEFTNHNSLPCSPSSSSFHLVPHTDYLQLFSYPSVSTLWPHIFWVEHRSFAGKVVLNSLLA